MTYSENVQNSAQNDSIFGGLAPLAAPIGRVLISAIFILSGISKLSNYEGTAAYMGSVGLPAELLPAVIAFEIIVPLLVVLGLFARSSAVLLAGFSVVTAVLFHSNFADQIQFILFMKNISMAGGFLFIVAHGPGILTLGSSRL